MEIKNLKLFSRSHVVTDWACPRKRFWQYEFKGKGIVQSNQSLDLYMGTIIHDGLSAIARGVGIDEISITARKQMVEALTPKAKPPTPDEVDWVYEQATLVEGILRGFFKSVWPRMIKSYPKILFIEQELLYDYEDMGFMAKPDLVLASEDGSEVVYFEYKSTRSKSEGWVKEWNTAVQLHSTIRAIQKQTGIEVNHVVVQGLYKGYETRGKQTSVFCYGYLKKGQPPFTQDQLQYEYRQGFQKSPTWEMKDGVRGWIDGMSPELLSEQFPQTPPIFINNDMIDAFFRQRKARESEIQLAMQILEGMGYDEKNCENVMDVAFPQHFDSCSNYFGRDCEYQRICFGDVKDPLNQGYEWRVSHHQPEIDQQKEKDEERNITEEVG